jgi:hypothetical protein
MLKYNVTIEKVEFPKVKVRGGGATTLIKISNLYGKMLGIKIDIFGIVVGDFV